MLIVDGLIVLSAKLVFSWETVLYGIIILYIISTLTDKVILGISQSKAFYIVTNKEEEVRKFLLSVNNAGVTMLNVKGGYSNTDMTMVYFIVDRFQISKMREIVHSIDEKAFITITEVADVFKTNM